MKAEGGWGVVSTGAVSTHPTSDDSPLPCSRLWDENDISSHAMMTEAVHQHGALAAGQIPGGPVLVFDFDYYYMGGVVAEFLAGRGSKVIYATPAGHASAWTFMTNEMPFVHQALHDHDVKVMTQTLLKDFDGQTARLEDVFTSKPTKVEVQSIVIVGHRQPCDDLYLELMNHEEEFTDAGIKTAQRIGDALAPGAIVHAVYSGHLHARQLDHEGGRGFLRDMPVSCTGPGAAYAGW
jgi:dimethylamine/trimethylamine dehydrogenase